MTTNILIAGFGGQGILFAGKFLAYQGLIEGKELSWLPSYGPEMRGGTANCSVIIGDEPVGSPIVSKPDILMVMNLPSLDKYEKDVVPGGTVIVDSTLIERKLVRDDVKAVYIPATAIAKESGHPTLANIILVGKMIRETGMLRFDDIEDGLKKVISAKHADHLGANLKALEAGYKFKD
ncbi:MAG: 2-oxoacid:acceptor oxidoreductase family protein [Clostridia bacterium]|nr:2-oxoacid:acceptor oxidoreductase family protein [Clostridia bacterium]